MHRGVLLAAFVLALPGCLEGTVFDSGTTIDPRDYLRDTQYTKWVVEVDAVQGMLPPDGTLEFVRSRIAEVVHKPDGVEIRLDDTGLQGRSQWDAESLDAAFDASLDTETKGNTVVTHLLFLDGTYGQGDNVVLGVTTNGYAQIAIFSQDIRESCTLLTACPYSQRQVFDAVTVHEFGHALGLVNRHAEGGKAPVPMQVDHEDDEHPGHSSNDQSVMYWAVESNDFLQALTGGLPNQFDANDRADLRAAGGR